MREGTSDGGCPRAGPHGGAPSGRPVLAAQRRRAHSLVFVFTSSVSNFMNFVTPHSWGRGQTYVCSGTPGAAASVPSARSGREPGASPAPGTGPGAPPARGPRAGAGRFRGCSGRPQARPSEAGVDAGRWRPPRGAGSSARPVVRERLSGHQRTTTEAALTSDALPCLGLPVVSNTPPPGWPLTLEARRGRPQTSQLAPRPSARPGGRSRRRGRPLLSVPGIASPPMSFQGHSFRLIWPQDQTLKSLSNFWGWGSPTLPGVHAVPPNMGRARSVRERGLLPTARP